MPRIFFRLLARVLLKREPVLNNSRQGREAGDASDLNPMRRRRPRKIPHLSRIRSRNQNSSHTFQELFQESPLGWRSALDAAVEFPFPVSGLSCPPTQQLFTAQPIPAAGRSASPLRGAALSALRLS